MSTNGLTPPAPGPGGKRLFTPEFKKLVVQRMKNGDALRDISAEYNINDSVLAKWRKGQGLGLSGHGSPKKKKPVTKEVKAKRKYTRHNESGAHHLLVLPLPLKDALSYLKLMNTWLYAALRDGKIKEFDEAHDLGRMALRELQKLL